MKNFLCHTKFFDDQSRVCFLSLQGHIFFKCSCNLKNPNIWTLGNKVDSFVCKITLFLTHSFTDANSNWTKVTTNIFYYMNELCMTCISKLPSCKQYRRTCSLSALCSSHPQIDSETKGRLYRSKIIRLVGPDWLYVKSFSLIVCTA
jgi:hypothetical protein